MKAIDLETKFFGSFDTIACYGADGKLHDSYATQNAEVAEFAIVDAYYFDELKKNGADWEDFSTLGEFCLVYKE